MIPLLLSAFATESVPEPKVFVRSVRDVVCVAADAGPPRGALKIASSPLGWVQHHRENIRQARPQVAEPAIAQDWLRGSVQPKRNLGLAFGASASPIDSVPGHFVVALEAQAWRREPAVFPNFTIVVDTSSSMGTVFDRKLPPLQNELSTIDFEPVTRGQLMRAALTELQKRLPPQSKLSIVAMDGYHARPALMSTKASDERSILNAIDRLEPSYVRGFDPSVHKELARISDLTFTPCHDNRVVILTDNVTEEFQRGAIESVARWRKGDVQVWSFGFGVTGDIDAQIAALREASGGASWMINSISDAQAVWDDLLDPGGRVHSDVVVELSLPPGTLWRESASGPWMMGSYRRELGVMESQQTWSRVLEIVPTGGEPVFAPTARYQDIEEQGFVVSPTVEIEPLKDAPSWARTRSVVYFWTNEQAERAPLEILDGQGQASEVRAWMAHTDPRYRSRFEITEVELSPEALAAREQWLIDREEERFEEREEAQNPGVPFVLRDDL